jgi:hypothetical protein
MKVYLDRNHCGVHQAACDSCFGRRIEVNFKPIEGGLDMDVAGCVMDIEEEEKKEIVTFYLKDRDGKDKVLEVNQENWPEAYDSWLDLYEKQKMETN